MTFSNDNFPLSILKYFHSNAKPNTNLATSHLYLIKKTPNWFYYAQR